mgnify:CR=1 FL=1
MAASGGSLCLLLIGHVLAVRMDKFLNNLSISEVMGDLYGPVVRVITAVSGILASVGTLAGQFLVMSKMLAMMLDLENTSATKTAAVIVIIYSAFGGARAVTLTDIFQLLVFSTLLPSLSLVIWNGFESTDEVVQVITKDPIFSLETIFSWDGESSYYWGLLLYYIIPGLRPPIFQRIIMASDTKQAKEAFAYAAALDFLMLLTVAWIATLLLATSGNLVPNKLVDHLIITYAYPGLRGFLVVGITALAMSTADSILNACSVLIVNDLIKPISPSFEVSVLAARTYAVVLGTLGLLLALLFEGNLLGLFLRSSSFYMPIVTVPLLMAIFGFKSSPRAALIGMLAGFLVVASWDSLFSHWGIQSLIPGMLANLVFLVGTHFLLGDDDVCI